jgi:WhiB family transcriptional regulator, redox-sensing transcriptional regulator
MSDRSPGTSQGLFEAIRPGWHADALCREYPAISWFPESHHKSTPATAICNRCLVKTQCLATAVIDGELGVWGGTNPTQRAHIARKVGHSVDLITADCLAPARSSPTKDAAPISKRQRTMELIHARGFADARPSHTRLLANLDRSGTRIAALAARTGVSPQAVRLLTRELEAKGYLTLSHDQRDARATIVHFTDRGTALLHTALEAITGKEIDHSTAFRDGIDQTMRTAFDHLVNHRRPQPPTPRDQCPDVAGDASEGISSPPSPPLVGACNDQNAAEVSRRCAASACGTGSLPTGTGRPPLRSR